MTAQLKLATPQGYYALTPQTLIDYLSISKISAAHLGGKPAQWKSREVGDGNLNLVFIVEGPKNALVVKQALPYVRLVGESWPLPLDRAHFEHMALQEQGIWAADYVPQIHEHDSVMALTVMEYLKPHIILRKGLIRGIQYPHMAEHVGKFLAHMLFRTSDLFLPAAEKRKKVSSFLSNIAMCKISEDLIFDEPYFDAPMNRHTSPQLDDISALFKNDLALKKAAQDMKWCFMNNTEALLHGDLHTGSVMVTDKDTRVIDPEFAFYGPMGFDIGAIIANLFMAYFSQPGHKNGDDYALWVLEQPEKLWNVFTTEFSALTQNSKGDVLNTRLQMNNKEAIASRLEVIWRDTLGFAACKVIRRILGLAHIEDFEAIEDQNTRAVCERKALEFARLLLIKRNSFKSMADVVKAAK
jgi:5-methylthioribose kinase